MRIYDRDTGEELSARDVLDDEEMADYTRAQRERPRPKYVGMRWEGHEE
jgi:hypothetical protein